MFNVLLSVELQKVSKVDAYSVDETVEIIKSRWTDSVGKDAISYNDFDVTHVQFDVLNNVSLHPKTQ